MLAQSFLSAVDLGITEPQRDALMKTLVLLETGKIKHVPCFEWNGKRSNDFTGHFNMKAWDSVSDCGTVHCLGGTAEAIAGDPMLFDGWSTGHITPLSNLFAPSQEHIMWSTITTAQAATALRSYLTTGDAKWHEAVA